MTDKEARRKRRVFFEIMKMIDEEGYEILRSENSQKTRNHIQHGTISVRRHSIDVAGYSVLIAERLHIKYHKRELIRGALLHDYFLYDWHDPEHCGLSNLHGFYHPGIALENAQKEYSLTWREVDIIKKHMWPLTIIPPKCREAWVVTMADKYCSTLETLHIQKGRVPNK